MADVRNNLTLTFSATLTLGEVEIRALDALVGYGDDAFLKVFKEKLGQSYIRDHEAGLRSAFTAIRTQAGMTLTPQQRAELRELAQRATPGPWRGGKLGYVTMPNLERVAECRRAAGFGAVENAAFIAAANPSTINALLDQIEEPRNDR